MRKSKRLIFIFFFLLAQSLFFTQSIIFAHAGDIQSFQAAIAIQRTDCGEWYNSLSYVTIGFTENSNAKVLPAPPPPPGYYIYSLIDPYSTQSDSNQFLNTNRYWRGYRDCWNTAILPMARSSAIWGVRIIDLYPYPITTTFPISIPLRISWDTNELSDGIFQLYLPQKTAPINMHEQTEIQTKIDFTQVQDNPNNRIIIKYTPYSEEKKVYSLICVGGTEEEQKKGRLYYEFSKLSMTTLKTFKRVDIDDKLLMQSKYITYDFYSLDIDLDGNIDSYDFSFLEISQKERLRKAITEWLPYTWKWKNTKNSVFFLYLIDHGNYSDGSINIDPLSSDPNNKSLSGNELNCWLYSLEKQLQKYEVLDYELIVVVEACYSGRFIEELKYACDDYNELNSHRILISSTDQDSKSKIIIDVQKDPNNFEGPDSFSKFFFNKIFRFKPASQEPYTIWESYKEAVTQINPTGGSEQKPLFYPDENRAYLIDTIPIRVDLDTNEPPIIKDCVMVDPYNFQKIEPQDITSCYRNFYFKVTISDNCGLKSVIMDIFYLNQDNEIKIDRIENISPYPSGDDNQLTFGPNYCFCYPGTYTLWIYVKDNNNNISIPYPLYFNIPELNDKYEPDGSIDQAGFLALNHAQSHFFSDSHDIDWIEVIIDTNNDYYLKITPLDQSLDDPNIFKINAYKIGNDLNQLVSINLPPLRRIEGGFYFYVKINWEIIGWSYSAPCKMFLEISPGTMAKEDTPYDIELNDPTTGEGLYSFIIRFKPEIKACLNITNTNDPNSIFIKSNNQNSLIIDKTITWSLPVPNMNDSLHCNFFCTQNCSNLYSLYIHNKLVMEMNLDNGKSMFNCPLNDPNADFDGDKFTNSKECAMGTDPLDPTFFPCSQSTPITQSIPLQAGWNLISFQINKCFYEGNEPAVFVPNKIDKVKTPSSLLSWFSDANTSPIRDANNPAMRGEWQRITSFDFYGAHILDKNLPSFINTLKYFSAGYGYWIKMNKEGVLILEGCYIPENTQIVLQKGWNLTGYIPHDICYGNNNKEQNDICPYKTSLYVPDKNIGYCKIDPNQMIKQVFQNISGKYRRIISFDSCNGAMLYDTKLPLSINTLHYLGPKYGYWIKMEIVEDILSFSYSYMCTH